MSNDEPGRLVRSAFSSKNSETEPELLVHPLRRLELGGRNVDADDAARSRRFSQAPK